MYDSQRLYTTSTTTLGRLYVSEGLSDPTRMDASYNSWELSGEEIQYIQIYGLKPFLDILEMSLLYLRQINCSLYPTVVSETNSIWSMRSRYDWNVTGRYGRLGAKAGGI